MMKILFFSAALLMLAVACAGTRNAPFSDQVVLTGSDPGNGIACAIGPAYTGTIPAPAQRAGYTTCVANYDFTSKSNFTYAGKTYNFSKLSTWLGCSGETTALWWNGGYNSRPSSCSNYSMTLDSAIGKNVLDMAFTAADANNSASATWMSQGNGNFGGPAATQTFNFPQGIYLDYTLEVRPADTNPYASDSTCQTVYCELMGFFSLGTSGAFQEWDALEMDAAGAKVYQSNNRMFPSNSGGAFTYHHYGMLLTTDGSTATWACGYLDGNGVSCYTKSIPAGGFTERQFYGIGVGSLYFKNCHSGGPCPAPSPTQHMRIQSIRILSCANWTAQQCNTGIISTP
jgi:hypothetical protein